MFEKTDAEKRFENERRERYQFIIDLRTTNPVEYQRVSATEKMNAARWEQEQGKTLPDTLPVFVQQKQFEDLLKLRQQNTQHYDETVKKLNPTTKMSLARYEESRRAAGL